MRTDLKRLRTEAAEAQAKANYRKALALYEEVCESDGTDALAHHRAGELFARLGKPNEAVRRLREAADLYADQGFLVKAIAVCKMILQTDASHEETQSHLVALYARKADSDTKPASHATPAPVAPKPAPVGPPRGAPAGFGEVDLASIESIPLGEEGGWSSSNASSQPAMHLMGNVIEESAPVPEPARTPPPRAPTPVPPPRAPDAPPLAARAGPPPPSAPRDTGDIELDVPDAGELLDLGLQMTPPPVSGAPPARPAPIAAQTPPQAAGAAAPAGGKKRSATEIRGATPRPLPKVEVPPPTATPATPAYPPIPPAHKLPSQPAIPQIKAPISNTDLYATPPSAASPAIRAIPAIPPGPVQPFAPAAPAQPPPSYVRDLAPPPRAPSPPAPVRPPQAPVAPMPPPPPPPPVRPALGATATITSLRGTGHFTVQPMSVSSGAEEIEAVEINIDDDPAPPVSALAAEKRGLPTTPLFEGLDAATLRELIDRIEYQRFDAGYTIVKEGEIGDAMFVIVDGEVQVVTGQPPREIGILQDGDFFGEISIISNFPRVATVTTVRETEVLRLSRAVVWELTEHHSDFLARLIKFVRDRLVSTLMKTSPLFLALPPAERAQLASQFRLLEVEEGRDIVKQGHRSEGLFVLLGGRLSLTIEKDGESRKIGDLGPGAIVGEVSLLTRQPATATVSTLNRCWVLWMSPQTFTEVLMTYPTVLEYIHELAEQRRQAVASIRIP